MLLQSILLYPPEDSIMFSYFVVCCPHLHWFFVPFLCPFSENVVPSVAQLFWRLDIFITT